MVNNHLDSKQGICYMQHTTDRVVIAILVVEHWLSDEYLKSTIRDQYDDLSYMSRHSTMYKPSFEDHKYC